MTRNDETRNSTIEVSIVRGARPTRGLYNCKTRLVLTNMSSPEEIGVEIPETAIIIPP
ncbi:MAG: hypothetical protein ACTSUQ_07710 [Candidatus Freyarchaeota archaeon]